MSGWTKEVNSDGEPLRDFYVAHDAAAFGLDCSSEPSFTRQEFKDECDINVLMATYEKTGMLPAFNPKSPDYLDVSEIPDLRESMEVVKRAEAAFMTLPAKVRQEFDNSAAAFVDWMNSDPDRDKLKEWGLLTPEPAPVEPISVKVVSEPAAPKASG